WVAGRAGLFAFFYLGHRLSKLARVTLINPRDAGPLDVLALDPVDASDATPGFFTCSPWPTAPTLDEHPVALVVGSGDNRIPRELVAATMASRGAPAPLVEAQTATWFGAAQLAAARAELVERIAGIQRCFPRARALGVFLAGPASLAFVVGRALNANIFPSIEVFEYRDRQYTLALETRPAPSPHPILFLAANPSNSQPLALEHEARAIRDELRRSLHPERFAIVARHEPRLMELRRLFKEIEPAVVHFSGHGSPTRLMLVKDDGRAAFVSADDIDHLFELGGARPRLIVLNACSSEAIAEHLLRHAECVIGMRWSIADPDAIRFATELYGALGDGESVQTAFDAARRAAVAGDGRAAQNDNELEIPQLKVRAGVDAGALVLIPPRT
ncbi:MAG TPA: CHAT domain-containing protein, partial [Kofleriaceae bacterium]|nr:CHAT domain-containing protein [Kofleriaceae bacterium]